MRKLLKRLETDGLVTDNGYVNLNGFDEKLWYCGTISKSKVQHEGEISEILLGVKCLDYRRLQDVDPAFRADVELETEPYGLVPWEHECGGGTNIKQMQEKFRRYGDRLVLWTCLSDSHLDKLCRQCPSDKHLFTTTAHAIADFHGPIWVDRKGERWSFPSAVQVSVQR